MLNLTSGRLFYKRPHFEKCSVMRKRDIIYGLIMTGLGFFAYLYAGRYALTLHLGRGSTGGDFFPRIMAAGLILTGSITFISAVISIHNDESAEPIKWKSLFLNLIILMLYYLLLTPLGFILDTALVTVYVMYRNGCRKWHAIILWAIVLPSIIFCLFYYYLYVGLPLGLLEPILPKY